MKVRAYKGPLTVFTTGVVGFSIFCIVAAAALADPRAPNMSAIEPQNIVDSAFSNLNTVAALTVEVAAEYISTPTPVPSDTLSSSPASSSTTPFFVPPTSGQATRTRAAGFVSTPTPTRIPSVTPSRTSVPTLTYTYIPPTFTYTPRPPDPDTDTPVPPSDTPEPTNTPIPTETPEPTSYP